MLYFAKYFAKYSLPFLLTFNRLQRDQNYFKIMPKRKTELSSLTLYFTNGYLSGQNFNYKIILEFLNEYYGATIQYHTNYFVCDHIKDMTIVFLLSLLLWAKDISFMPKATIYLIMPQIATYFAKYRKPSFIKWGEL